MSRRSHVAEHLDVAAFAADAGELSGQWALAALPRLAADQPAESPPASPVRWWVRGERRGLAGGHAETWLHLKAQVVVQRECQRCLAPVGVALEVDRPFRFVSDEETAAALDAEMEEDVLALEPVLDLRHLVEDELLLALPIVPRHEVCPEPLPLPDADLDEPAVENPFAALAALRRTDSGH